MHITDKNNQYNYAKVIIGYWVKYKTRTSLRVTRWANTMKQQNLYLESIGWLR